MITTIQQIINALARSPATFEEGDRNGDRALLSIRIEERAMNTRRLQQHFTWNLMVEEFETRICLSTVSFATHVIIESQTNAANSVYAADVDGDGDSDVLSASADDGKIAWYENSDGMGEFSEQRVITSAAKGARSVHAVDLDRDGDVDVLSASFEDDKIAWYENMDGNGSFGDQQVISSTAFNATSVYAADIDGDGDVDVLSSSSGDDKIAWYENTDGNGRFGEQRVITTAAVAARSVFGADVDGDGDMDVLAAFISTSVKQSNVAWYENTDGLGSFGEQQGINTDSIMTVGSGSVFASDLDDDGDLDVISGASRHNNIAWHENIDGDGTFAEQQVISTKEASVTNTGEDEVRSVYATDMDGDGDLDILSASSGGNNIAWYENTDGEGSFGKMQVISTGTNDAKSAYAIDIDGDGDMDVLSASSQDDTIAWYENIDGKGTFGEQRAITTSAAGARSVDAADMDGDGDLDVLSASIWDNKIAWYENTNGNGVFGSQRVISTTAYRAMSVAAADVDGDRDVDVLSASLTLDRIAWYENSDGASTFGDEQIISSSAAWPIHVHVADVDGDGDMDALSASYRNDTIAWYENTDSKGTFGEPRVITNTAIGAGIVYSADFDGDGDIDVLSGSSKSSNNMIAWYENTDGTGNFSETRVISAGAATGPFVHAADINGDGHVDVLSASYGNKVIAWYENSDGKGTFSERRIISESAHGVQFVNAEDLDGDGDVDVVAASPSDNKVMWYENIDGKGSFGKQMVITDDAETVVSVHVSDIDGDGDVDILSASSDDDKIAWYENLSPPRNAGDANRDGVFDQMDIVEVLQAGRYLTGESATFAEGDWNGDGVFDQLDVVAALQSGKYLQGLLDAQFVDAAITRLD